MEAAMDATRWRHWEVAPAGPGPWTPGPLRHPDGDPLHGVWSCDGDAGSEVVVAANYGVAVHTAVVPRRRWRFASELVRVSNEVLARTAWYWARGERWRASCPRETAIALVRARHRPLAVVETCDAAQADAWADAARRDGLVVRRGVEPAELCAIDVESAVVGVSVPGTLGQRFDLDALLDDYARCLPVDPFVEVVETIDDLREVEIGDLLELDLRAGRAFAGPLARYGLANGHHPALTAGAILRLGTSGARGDIASARALAGELDAFLATRAEATPLPHLPATPIATPATPAAPPGGVKR